MEGKGVMPGYGLSHFQAGDTKLETFLHKNQRTQRKLGTIHLRRRHVLGGRGDPMGLCLPMLEG